MRGMTPSAIRSATAGLGVALLATLGTTPEGLVERGDRAAAVHHLGPAGEVSARETASLRHLLSTRGG